MSSVYFIASEDSFLIQNKLKEILGKYENQEIVYYDLKETPLESVIEDLDTLNFFTERKVIVAEHAYFLTSEKLKNQVEQNTDVLMKYLKNPNSENILVITCSKLDERKAIVKEFKKYVQIIDPSVDLIQVVDKALEGYQISFSDKRYLIDRTLGNYERIVNEILKIKLFKEEDKIITREDIDMLVTKTIDDNIFTLVDAIIQKNKKFAFEIYEDMLLHNEEPMKIMILLANKIRLLYQVKVLSKTFSKDEEIGKIIGSHPYPVKLARNLIRDFKEEDLLRYLDQLAHIDMDIKSGRTYQNIAFETFILTL